MCEVTTLCKHAQKLHKATALAATDGEEHEHEHGIHVQRPPQRCTIEKYDFRLIGTFHNKSTVPHTPRTPIY